MGKKAAMKRKRPQGNGAANGNETLTSSSSASNKKKQKQCKAAQYAQDEGEDVDFASLGFADALAVGLAFQQLGAHDSAAEAYARAVELESAHYGALCRLADACADAGDEGAALKHYTAASGLSEASGDASLWLRLGMAQAAADQVEKAIGSYTKATELAEKDAAESEDARRTYGMALAAQANVLGMEKGDVEGAVQVYEEAVAKFPQNANLHFNLATMLLASGDEKRAIASLRNAIQQDGDVVEFYEELVALLKDGKEKTELVMKMKELRRKATPAQEVETKDEEDEDEEEEEEDDDDDDDDEEDGGDGDEDDDE